jgi:predicted RNA-binding protein YlxR (DUF448 family)
MTRGGHKDEGNDGPERRCIATGESAPRAGLVRFVLGPGGVIVPDVGARLPGRGIWVTASRPTIGTALRKGLFARAARQPVTAPPDLADQVEGLLVRRLVDTIALARKAGQAVTGLEKVKEWLTSGQAAALVQASDGSPRERARLRPPAGPDSLIGCLTAGELGLAFGRERAIHGALSAGGLARRALEEAARLSGLRDTARVLGQVGLPGKGTKEA